MTIIEEQQIKDEIEERLLRAYENYVGAYRAQGLIPRGFDDWVAEEWLTDDWS